MSAVKAKARRALPPTARAKDQILHASKIPDRGWGHGKRCCAWQKGANKSFNDLLREFCPKGRNLSRVSPAPLKQDPALLTPGLVRYCLRKKPLCGFFARCGRTIP